MLNVLKAGAGQIAPDMWHMNISNTIIITSFSLFVAMIVYIIVADSNEPEKPCPKFIEVISMEIQVVPQWGDDDIYYYHTFNDGSKEMSKYTSYKKVGYKECVY